MPPLPPIQVTLAVAGALLVLAGLAVVRASGARAGIARRLGGARGVRIGELLDIGASGPLPPRPVRVQGRIRCADPIVTAEDDRLVAFHRDVEVREASGGWRSVERLRESRSFELWDHDGSLAIDPASAAEPLVVLPHVWQGPPADLGESYAPALARLAAEGGELVEARATTRMVSVIDRLLVLAEVRRDRDAVMLTPPAGGYVISALELDDAMRLLGGGRPRLLLAGAASVAIGAALIVAGLVVGIAGLVVG